MIVVTGAPALPMQFGLLWNTAPDHAWIISSAALLAMTSTAAACLTLHIHLLIAKVADLARHFPPAIAELIASDGISATEGGTEQVTVLFPDIRSFTAMSAQLVSREVVSRLNDCFARMLEVVEVVEKHPCPDPEVRERSRRPCSARTKRADAGNFESSWRGGPTKCGAKSTMETSTSSWAAGVHGDRRHRQRRLADRGKRGRERSPEAASPVM